MQKLDQDFASLAQTEALLTLSSKANPLKSVLNKKDLIPSQKVVPAGSKFDESLNKVWTLVNGLFYFY